MPLVPPELVVLGARLPVLTLSRESGGAWVKARCDGCHWLSGQVLTNPALRLCSPFALCAACCLVFGFTCCSRCAFEAGVCRGGVALQREFLLIKILICAVLHVCRPDELWQTHLKSDYRVVLSAACKGMLWLSPMGAPAQALALCCSGWVGCGCGFSEWVHAGTFVACIMREHRPVINPGSPWGSA